MYKSQVGDRVFELILGPEYLRDLRGFCLFVIGFFLTIGKKNPLKYSIPDFLFALNNVD